MVNENNNLQETEHIEIGRLIGTLKRVQAPKDFDFHVRARIAKGRPAEKRVSWLPASVRYAAPLGLLLAVGGYVGFSTMYSPGEVNISPVAYAPAEMTVQPVAAIADPVKQSETLPVAPSNETLAVSTPSDTGNKVKNTVQKAPVTPNPKTEKPDGGSYDIAGPRAHTITQPDIDDNAPPPARKVIVPASQFLNSAGINSSGGKIVSVSGAAASAGLRAGDVIESVNVQTGTIRVNRDGKSVTVTIK